MALDVKLELINGASVQETPTSVTIYRMARVKGFLDPDNAHLAIVDAHTAPGLPVIGDPYPDREFAVLRNKFSVPVSDDLAFVTMVYQWQQYQSAYLKNFRATLQQRIINYDKDGVPAVLTYTPPGSTKADKYTCDIQQMFPSATLAVQRIETGDPEAVAAAYLGGVNNATWRGYPARTWLFLGLDATTDDNVWYRDMYTWIYNPRTWDEFQVYRDGTGRVPKGVDNVDFSGVTTSGNGWKRFRAQPEVNFSAAFPWV